MRTSNTLTLYQLINRLWAKITRHRRFQLQLLLVLMIAVSFSEIISIGAILPFLGVLTNPGKFFEIPLVLQLSNNVGITTTSQLLLVITLTFILITLLSAGLRLLLLWCSSRLSYAVGADLSMSIYRRTLYQPYAVHVSRNSSEIINGISNKTVNVIVTIYAVLTLIGSSIIILTVLIGLLVLNPLAALLVFIGFGSIYLVFAWLTQKKMKIQGQLIARESTKVIKTLQEALGGIRDILIDGAQEVYCDIYRSAETPLRRAQGSTQFISQSPRYGMEALGIGLIALLAYILSLNDEGLATAIPILGALALGSQRLLPVLQQAYQAWSNIQSSQASVLDALALLEQPLPDLITTTTSRSISFSREIYIKQLGFRYDDTQPWIFRNISLTIPKGSRVGFIGGTGSGKSTLLDIVMGLLSPCEGSLQVDGEPITKENHRLWQAHIAHVPQVIYLADGTINENIAFGVPVDQIDFEKVVRAAKIAQISQTIEGWRDQYKTKVGERGIRLSGGQRQRIGIARALYKNADVFIFDEATSALDSETERAVMKAIDNFSNEITILVIAHRITTLKNCNKIVELENKQIKRIGSYQEIVSSQA